MNAMYLMYLCILPWNHGSLAENICFEDANSYLPAVTIVVVTNLMASWASIFGSSVRLLSQQFVSGIDPKTHHWKNRSMTQRTTLKNWQIVTSDMYWKDDWPVKSDYMIKYSVLQQPRNTWCILVPGTPNKHFSRMFGKNNYFPC